MNSLICVPIIVRGEVKGIIHLDSMKRYAFDKEDLNFAELLSKQVAIAFERALLYEEVKKMAIIDALTGCFNRKKLEEDLDSEIYRCNRYNRKLSIIMIDIDYFKKYNDYHGHKKGDDLLKKVCKLLKDNLRKSDKAYRYGGEEFLIMLPETDKEQAYCAAERLRRIIENEKFDGEQLSQPGGKLTISLGVACYPDDAKSKEDLIIFADCALYEAKKTGRNKVVSFDFSLIKNKTFVI